MTDVVKNTTDLNTGSVGQEKLVPLMNGSGLVPIGGIISIMPHLAGAFDTPNTTTADLNGWVRCNGQTINDPQSPLNGLVVPNLNDDVFLSGNVTSGSGGGQNLKCLVCANIPSHVHSITHCHCISHGHSDSFCIRAACCNHSHTTPSHAHSSGDLYATYVHDGTRANWKCRYVGGIAQWVSTMRGGGGFGNCAQPQDKGTWVCGATALGGGASTGLNSTKTNCVYGCVTSSTAKSGTSLTANTGSSGSGSGFNNRPKYITSVYLMRIK